MSKFKVAQAEDRYRGLAEALLSNPLGQVVFYTLLIALLQRDALQSVVLVVKMSVSLV